jgi:hypothetical protein
VTGLDGDGLVEVTGIDYALPQRPAELSQCTYGRLAVVLAWQDGAFVEAPGRYGRFYESKAEEARAWLTSHPPSESDVLAQDCHVAMAQTLLYARVQQGECQDAWLEYLALVNPSQLMGDKWHDVIDGIDEELASFTARRLGCP